MTLASSLPGSERIVSMDQFRGYTVAGMFVVNFLGGMAAIPANFAHHNTYFSYADSIMPSFIFAAGFSYRLSILRRLQREDSGGVYRKFLVRSLLLVLVSIAMYGLGTNFKTWQEAVEADKYAAIASFIKADLWEVLAIIGICQVFIMPVIAASAGVRFFALLGCVVAHVLLSYAFNYAFVTGEPNFVSNFWGVESRRCFDGGPFGIISWSVAMLAGTLCYDIVYGRSSGKAAAHLLWWGTLLMIIGYALSCLTTLYNQSGGSVPTVKDNAASPVWPPFENAKGREFKALLAEPPFVPPPPTSERPLNYWQMTKRIVSSSFILFSSGFAFFLYGVFVLACDIGGLQVGLFRTFGRNPLIAYVIHHGVEQSIRPIVPKDSPLWWALTGFAIFFGLTYLFVRYLEKRDIYIRL